MFEAMVIFLSSVLLAQSGQEFPALTGPYLGQRVPGLAPELFAPGIVCTGFNERDITITPDGKEIYYGWLTGRHITIMQTRLLNGRWSEPEVAPFAREADYFYLEPCLSTDGQKIYFLSTRPPEGKEPKPRWAYQNIWTCDRNPDGTWGAPYMVEAINHSSAQFYPSLTNTGTIYYTSTEVQTKKSIIMLSRFQNGEYQPPEILPPVINQEGTTIYNTFISPDERFLIACIDGIKSDVNPGFANYYIFFRDKSDRWSEGIAFGPEINIKGSAAISASLSPDGKYLFFAAQKVSAENAEMARDKKLGTLMEFLRLPQNGNHDIYWVDARVIDSLAKTLASGEQGK
jgi:hypothetical protein